MKKIILAILMITSILTLSEEKTITENNGTLIKKYNSDGILVEVVNNEAEDLGIVKSVEKLSDDGKVYEKLEYENSYYIDSDGDMDESYFDYRILNSYIYDNQDEFNKVENLDYYGLSERATDKKINVSKNILILNNKSKFISDETSYVYLYAHVHNSEMYQTVTKRSVCLSCERWNYTPVSFDCLKQQLFKLDEKS